MLKGIANDKLTNNPNNKNNVINVTFFIKTSTSIYVQTNGTMATVGHSDFIGEKLMGFSTFVMIST